MEAGCCKADNKTGTAGCSIGSACCKAQDEKGDSGCCMQAKDPVEAALLARLQSLIEQKPIMLFIKGTKEAPKCKFSKKLVSTLIENGVVSFGTYDVLADEAVRAGLKQLSGYNTYPQVYINGELIGGTDAIVELANSGKLLDRVPASSLRGAGHDARWFGLSALASLAGVAGLVLGLGAALAFVRHGRLRV